MLVGLWFGPRGWVRCRRRQQEVGYDRRAVELSATRRRTCDSRQVSRHHADDPVGVEVPAWTWHVVRQVSRRRVMSPLEVLTGHCGRRRVDLAIGGRRRCAYRNLTARKWSRRSRP